MSTRRIVGSTLAGGLSEIANKIFPLIIFNYAQRKLGLEMFGYSQFGIYLVDLFVPFVVWGYNNAISIKAGEAHKNKLDFSEIVSTSLVLRMANAVIAAIVLTGLVNFYPAYAHYKTIAYSLCFILFTSALDLSQVLVATQKIYMQSYFSIISKTISLFLIL